MQDKDQQICQLLMYTLLLEPTNARIYYEKRLQYYAKPTTLFLYTALLNGKNMLTIKTITPLPIITNLVFYSKTKL
jgi:hypothetical protein